MSPPVDDVPTSHRPASVRERLSVLGVGLLGNQVIALSALACYLTLVFYDWSKKDWLGIEAIKDLRHGEGQGRLTRLIGRLLRRSDWLALVALSIKFDPFIVVAYLRPGSYRFNGLSRREWGMFWLSVLISNLYWSFVAFTGVTVLHWAWTQFGA